MMKNKSHGNKFIRMITTPFRALAKVRDMYVKSLSSYAGNVYYGSAAFGGVSYADPLPRSFSTNLNRSREKDDFKELVRAASTSTLGNRVDMNSGLSGLSHGKQERVEREKTRTDGCSFEGVPRSASVGMAKIEEDEPCEFDDDNNGDGDHHHDHHDIGVNHDINKKHKINLFPRSRSYGVGAIHRK